MTPLSDPTSAQRRIIHVDMDAFYASVEQRDEVRPTSRAKEKAKRDRRRPDPFELSTVQVREWFDAEPWRTSRELFERLQGKYPGVYRDGQVRTLQQRLKGWRQAMAHQLVFGVATLPTVQETDVAR